MEYYPAVKRNEVLIHATTWMNTENMPSERSQTQKIIFYSISIKWLEQASPQIENIGGCQELWGRNGE